MPKPLKNRQLLVEGKNDKHVVFALCKKYDIKQTFDVIVPSDAVGDADGVDALVKGIPQRLKQPDLRAMGIMVDADEDMRGRWASVMNYLQKGGYSDLPEKPVREGFISAPSGKPRIGVWLMPDNQLPGDVGEFYQASYSPE